MLKSVNLYNPRKHNRNGTKILALFLFPLWTVVLGSTAYAQGPDYFGQAIQAIYVNLGGVIPPGVDLSSALNSVLFLFLPFLLVVAAVYDMVSIFKIFRSSWVRGILAVGAALLLVPSQGYARLILWIVASGGAAVGLIFAATFLVGASRYARERFKDIGYHGPFSNIGVVYGTATFAWGLFFAIGATIVFGGAVAPLGFVAGMLFGLVIAALETRKGKAARSVARIAEATQARVEDLQKQMVALSRERANFQRTLESLLRQGGARENNPEIVALRRQISSLTKQIQDLELQMEQAQEQAQAEGERRRQQAGVPA